MAIVDDHRLVRAGLKRVLTDTPGIDVVAEADFCISGTVDPDIVLPEGLELRSMLLERDNTAQLVYKHAISTIQPLNPVNLAGNDEDDDEDGVDYDDDGAEY